MADRRCRSRPSRTRPTPRSTRRTAGSWRTDLTVNGGIRWEGQDVRNRDGRVRVQAERQLGAAHRLRLGRRRGTAAASSTRTGAGSSRASRWTSTSARSAARSQCFCYNFEPRSRRTTSSDAGAPARAVAARRRGAGRSELEGPVHRRVAGRLRIRVSASNIVVGAKFTHSAISAASSRTS